MQKIKVLFFAANPRGTDPLDLNREFREIDEEVRLGRFRNVLELIVVPGTRLVDLLRKLNEHRPHIVHFSGHGNIDEEIILEGGVGDLAYPDNTNSSARDIRRLESVHHSRRAYSPRPLSKSALVDILKACNEENIRVVVLNACHTRPQAEALSEVIECSISMNRGISDEGATKFAASFYGALAYGVSVKKAFDQGLARLKAESISETETPELAVRAGVDASTLVLVGPREHAAAKRREVARTDTVGIDARNSQLKYYVYISTSKIEMLYPQIVSSNACQAGLLDFDLIKLRGEAAGSRGVPANKFAKLDAIVEELVNREEVGPIDGGKPYIKGTCLEMVWGNYGSAPITFWGHGSGKLIVGLAGSKHHVLGEEMSGRAHSHSLTDAIVKWLHQQFGQSEAGDAEKMREEYEEILHGRQHELDKPATAQADPAMLDLEAGTFKMTENRARIHQFLGDQKKENRSLDNDEISLATYLAVTQMAGQRSKFDFVARVLHRAHYPQGFGDGGFSDIILATPLYVALEA